MVLAPGRFTRPPAAEARRARTGCGDGGPSARVRTPSAGGRTTSTVRQKAASARVSPCAGYEASSTTSGAGRRGPAQQGACGVHRERDRVSWSGCPPSYGCVGMVSGAAEPIARSTRCDSSGRRRNSVWSRNGSCSSRSGGTFGTASAACSSPGGARHSLAARRTPGRPTTPGPRVHRRWRKAGGRAAAGPGSWTRRWSRRPGARRRAAPAGPRRRRAASAAAPRHRRFSPAQCITRVR